LLHSDDIYFLNSSFFKYSYKDTSKYPKNMKKRDEFDFFCKILPENVCSSKKIATFATANQK